MLVACFGLRTLMSLGFVAFYTCGLLCFGNLLLLRVKGVLYLLFTDYDLVYYFALFGFADDGLFGCSTVVWCLFVVWVCL